MLIIRLQRKGKIHSPFYRVVVAEKANHVNKEVHEVLGTYNPKDKKLTISDNNRVDFYVKNNTHMSDTIKSLFLKNNLITK